MHLAAQAERGIAVEKHPVYRTLTIVIPVYNERGTVMTMLEKVLRQDTAPLAKEVVVVDDGSIDGTRELLESAAWENLYREPDDRVQLLTHARNRGKGACLKSALAAARGELVLVQDADLEYDPADYPALLGPLVQGKADVVYGSRFLGSGPHRVLYYWHSVGNWLLTILSNALTNMNMSDMETCYKVFRREILQAIPIEEDRFGFEPEITVKIAKRGLRVYEVGISYWGRTYEEGKKIGWKDGFRALWCLLKYTLQEPSQRK
jgi:glycosyltransferase involved in cell wall biosynthesis